MTIEIALDSSATRIELLGRIEIRDSHASISCRDTFVDAWLRALLEGLMRARRNGRAKVDLVVEPTLLIADLEDQVLSLAYGDVSLKFDVDDFESELRAASGRFLEVVRRLPPGNSNPWLQELEEYVRSEPRS